MSAAKKKPSAPDLGGLKDDWGRLAEMRRQEQTTPTPTPQAPSVSPTIGPTVKAARPAMTRRSWYVERDAADAFAAAVDDVHYATRIPKHIVASTLMRAAAAQADRVAEELSHSSHS